jgi:dipeptidyl aminopeptidase/acylaminoacyl peptidase
MRAAHGEWPSPITAEAVVAASVSLGEILIDGSDVLWSEMRPDEGGRVQVVRRGAGGSTTDLLPEGFSARTRVHEYGGGAWFPSGEILYFCNWDDQRIHRLDTSAEARPGPQAITPEPTVPGSHRYADIRAASPFLVCVRERHEADGNVVNEIVAVRGDGGDDGSGAVQVLVSGPDFVSNPRISPGGDRMAWIQWDHPHMPWDATQLHLAPIRVFDDHVELGKPSVVAGGPSESVIQPVFSSDGTLHFLSDRSGWWNAHALREHGTVVAETDDQAEIGTPQWVFGMSRYGFLADGRMVFARSRSGVDGLAIRTRDGLVTELDVPFTEIASVATRQTSILFVGAGFDREPAVVEVPVEGPEHAAVAGEVRVLRPARELGLSPAWFSVATPVSFPSGADGDRTAHGLYYPPTNPEVDDSPGAPPLLVLIHGGPTGTARARLDLAKQYWTSRGFALVDVNYAGSTGFGRAYRDLLGGQWGVADVEDCVAAATWLADQGLADPDRLCIRGGSAGGFTVLAALVQTDVFAAGACSYGVADLAALAAETHKFESRYLDGLVGPYPEAESVYRERSPIHHVDRLESPLIVFQGLEDEIVPPNQSEMVVEALRSKGVPVAYLAFEGEQHGFRRAETVIRVLESELAFYGRVLGFAPAGDLPELEIAGA